jgi:hypothetical protein
MQQWKLTSWVHEPQWMSFIRADTRELTFCYSWPESEEDHRVRECGCLLERVHDKASKMSQPRWWLGYVGVWVKEGIVTLKIRYFIVRERKWIRKDVKHRGFEFDSLTMWKLGTGHAGIQCNVFCGVWKFPYWNISVTSLKASTLHDIHSINFVCKTWEGNVDGSLTDKWGTL